LFIFEKTMTAGENAAANDATAVQGEETNNAAVVAEPPAVVAAATQQESKEDNGSDDDDADEGGAGLSDAVRLQKRKERLEQNRISARESRKRKKTMIEELQRTVITLSKENKDLNDRNEQLRSQLMEIGRKVRALSCEWIFGEIICV
jgi:HPt (histidine-containing phosphotransfer) domain-containing protein